MEASIGVSQATKDSLREDKPGSVSWDTYLTVMRESLDQKRFQKNMEAFLDDLEKESSQAAIERVLAMRSGAESGLRHAEAKERLHTIRLARQLAKYSEILLSATSPAVARKAVKSLDKELHSVIA